MYKLAVKWWILWSNWNLRKESNRFVFKREIDNITLLKKYWKINVGELVWKPDGIRYLFNSMKPTQTMLEDGGGDCEDWAWLASMAFKSGFMFKNRFFYKFDHFHLYRKGFAGHVAAVFKCDGLDKDIVFSNDQIYLLKEYKDWSHATHEAIVDKRDGKLVLRKVIKT